MYILFVYFYFIYFNLVYMSSFVGALKLCLYLTAVLLFRCVVEDRNFALFNFVNEQNNEAEALRDQISQVSMFPLFDCACRHTRH